jgi:hypothetical protein
MKSSFKQTAKLQALSNDASAMLRFAFIARRVDVTISELAYARSILSWSQPDGRQARRVER